MRANQCIPRPDARGFNALLPFLGRNLESDLFELRQQTHDRIVKFQLAIIAIFVCRDRGDQRRSSNRIQLCKQPSLQRLSHQQRTVYAQVRQPPAAIRYLLKSKIEIAKVVEHARAPLEWFPNISAQAIDLAIRVLDGRGLRL